MPLPGALLFPRALLPLYIFEPRYRQMLAHALDDHRMFCVSLLKPKRSDWRTSDDFCEFAGIGLIRACVGRGDGTSNLILQGLSRVRFVSFEQMTPFPIARIQPLESIPAPEEETQPLGEQLLKVYEKFRRSGRELSPQLARYLSDLSDPEMLADLMAATFINDPMRRQHVLEELRVDERLRLVVRYLREESGSAAA